MGGRGALSRASGEKRGLNFGKGKGKPSLELYPARMNRNVNTGSLDRMALGFDTAHGGAPKEFAVTVDTYGYATSYFEGSSGSVNVPDKHLNGTHLVHNHPRGGWGNFSGQDLDSFANSGVRGMSAISRNLSIPKNASLNTKKAYSNRRSGEYRISKTNHFDRNGFTEAIRQIKVRDDNYDKDLHRWLSRNQQKYGYKYSYTKATNKV